MQCMVKIITFLKFFAAFFALNFFSFNASAYTCTGPVRGVSIEANGDILAESAGSLNWPRFCNVRTVMNAVQPEACRAMYGALLMAQGSGKQVTLWMSGDNTCTGLPAWQFVPGFYFIRVN